MYSNLSKIMEKKYKRYKNVFELLDECSKEISSQESKNFIANGVKLGLNTVYNITIKKCNNKEGFSVNVSCFYKGNVITITNISGLPIE